MFQHHNLYRVISFFCEFLGKISSNNQQNILISIFLMPDRHSIITRGRKILCFWELEQKCISRNSYEKSKEAVNTYLRAISFHFWMWFWRQKPGSPLKSLYSLQNFIYSQNLLLLIIINKIRKRHANLSFRFPDEPIHVSAQSLLLPTVLQ